VALSLLLGSLPATAAEEQAPSEDALDFAEAAVPVDGSEAEDALQVQVAAQLFTMEQGSRPTCKPKLLNARVIEPERHDAWVERWLVRGCLEILPYRVAFAPDPQSGAVAFTVTEDVGTHGAPSH